MDRIAALKEILAGNPNDAFARYGLAMEYSKTGALEAALAEFCKIVEVNPDYTAAYQMAGQMLSNAGRFGEARKMLENGMACARRVGNQHAVSEMQGMVDLLPE
ncbi:MAG: tetratricopeptide repeat protein [Terriglobales bacterium]